MKVIYSEEALKNSSENITYKEVYISWGLHNWQKKFLLGVLSLKIRFFPHRQKEEKFLEKFKT